MPQPAGVSKNNNRKKNGGGGGGGGRKKGRAPAHQNTFAYRHNPKSTKTAAILSAPIEHVCRRCRDKLEWRKRYRKYKPLTNKPRKCNLCHRPACVRAAYHTICTGCTTSSSKAMELLERWNNDTATTNGGGNERRREGQSQSNGGTVAATETETAGTDVTETPIGTAGDVGVVDSTTTAAAATAGNDGERDGDDDRDVTAGSEIAGSETGGRKYRRVCAVCVKEPALPCEDDDDDEEDDEEEKIRRARAGKKLRLRDKKRIERQRERAANLKKKKKRDGQGENQQRQDDEDDHDDIDDDDDDSSDGKEDEFDGSGSRDDDEDDDEEEESDDDDDVRDVDEDDDDDPFLKAVGGKEKLLTGEAYRKMMLQKGSAT